MGCGSSRGVEAVSPTASGRNADTNGTAKRQAAALEQEDPQHAAPAHAADDAAAIRSDLPMTLPLTQWDDTVSIGTTDYVTSDGSPSSAICA